MSSSAPRPFEIFLYAGFAGLFFLAIFLFATFSGDRDGTGGIGRVVIWGVLDQRVVERHVSNLASNDERFRGVQYRQVSERNLQQELLNAIAEGRQPDMVLIPHTQLVQQRSILFPVSYADGITTRQFADRYLEGFEVFARPNGLYALPVAVDPLIMYWNRDIYANNRIVEPPRTWETVVNDVVPTIVRRSTDRTISMSPIALGEYRNNRNAYATLSALLLQGGSRIAAEHNGQYRLELNTSQSPNVSNPFTSAVQFFTQFARPSSPLYSWNRTKRTDREEFLAGNLATYFGYGSEDQALREQNPNLNFDAAPFPQAADATAQRTYGTFYGLAILRSSRNIGGAYQVGRALTSEQSLAALTQNLMLAPPYRSTISAGTTGHARQIIYNSAIIARGWLNPNYSATDQILQQTLDDLLAGRTTFSRISTDVAGLLRRQY